MDEIITEKNYPIQGLWLLKANFASFFVIVVFIFFFVFANMLSPYSPDQGGIQLQVTGKPGYYDLIVIIGFVILNALFTILNKITFHYSVEDKFLFLRQGILSKRERHIPYGVIQNLFVKQDLLDRILGLASLTIENASQGAGALYATEREKVETIGSSGNRVRIPGLKKANAEFLKGIILQKMKENPVEDSQSGL